MTRPELTAQKGVVYEHVKVTPEKLKPGVSILSLSRLFKPLQNFFGADEALTDYVPGSTSWTATLIITGNDRSQAWEKALPGDRKHPQQVTGEMPGTVPGAR